MRDEQMMAQLQRLLDKDAIRDVIYKYCRGMDRRDWDLVASTFHPGAYDDHGVYRGDAGGFIEFSKPRHDHVTMSMHHIGNILIEFQTSERALVESYCIGTHRYAPGGEGARKAITSSRSEDVDKPLELTMWVRYVDVVTKRDGEWRIENRSVVWEGLRADVVPSDGPLPGSDWVVAKRDHSDTVYERQRALALGR